MLEQPQQDMAKREAIVNAATRIFAEKGFQGASNREIAREAGISSGLIYWYFRDKSELFRAVIQNLFPLKGLQIPDEPATNVPLETLLGGIGSQFMAIMTTREVLQLIRLALNEIIQFPDVWQKVGEMIAERAIDPLASQLAARVDSGEIPPVDTRMAAQAYFGALIGYVLRKYLYRSDDLRESEDGAYVDVVARIYASGLTHGDVPST
jgi:AcrR family transcriptional regulator